MTVALSYQQAADLLDLAVETRGEHYIYPKLTGQCQYYDFFDIHGNVAWCDEVVAIIEPSCIVGWILHSVGIAPTTMTCGNDEGVHSLVRYHDISIDLKTALLLAMAQSLQDNGVSWGKAVAEAKRVASVLPESLDIDRVGIDIVESGSEDVDTADYFDLAQRYLFLNGQDPELVPNGTRDYGYLVDESLKANCIAACIEEGEYYEDIDVAALAPEELLVS